REHGLRDKIQPKIDAVLRESEHVFFARVVVIENKFIQVITEFDNGPVEYTKFFLKELPDVFETIFSLAEGVPSWDTLKDPDIFHAESKKLNLKSLGKKEDEPDAGYLFAAFENKTVKEIKAALK
ncbi:hypothetical protein, partial [Methylomonas koyamae]